MADFKTAWLYTRENEGGLTETDTGGVTKFGITQKTISEFLGEPLESVPRSAVEKLIEPQAMTIAQALYWKKIWGDQIDNQSIATALFDTAFNRGVLVAIRYAQMSFNSNPLVKPIVQDGVMGEQTLSAINSVGTNNLFLRSFERYEIAGYEAIIAHNPAMDVNRDGWEARARRLLTLINVQQA